MRVVNISRLVTNRIESNWNQLKLLLGHKTRIDKTIAGLLQHQMTITQQIVTTIGQQHSTSRLSKIVPRFFSVVARRLSFDVLTKVKTEWERYVALTYHATCKRVGGTTSHWNVDCFNQTFRCHDMEWSCSCLFFKSNRLSCRHLMYVAHEGRGFEMLPAMTVHERWNTLSALEAKVEHAAAADSLLPIVQMSTVTSPKVKLPKDENKEFSVSGPKGPKQIVYIRLKRHERANQVVLSSAEKYSYAKAMLEPLLDHLSNLSSVDFYRELEAWKKTVDSGLGRTNKRTAQRSTHKDNVIDDNGNESGSEASEMATFDPAEAVGTATLMDALEGTPIDELSNEDEDELPPTQLTHVKPNIPQSKSLCTTEQNHEVIAANVKHGIVKHFPALKQPTRQVGIINVPKPKRRGRSRASPKQMRQMTLSAKSGRVAVHKYPSDLSVTLDQLLTWARNTPNLKDVMSIMEKYPVQLDDAYLRARTIECQWQLVRSSDYMYTFVIPSDLARSMQAAVITARKEKHKPDETTDLVKTQGVGLDVIASIDPKLWKFSG
ncbi:unnamed protein product [Phytophthora fragariaefolia]|uniref:Unnamed protein product n=1 Tax=Phytophthora fragariaefolia TaxID=1490495 RepID=A0A9W6WSR4_9STRA|nr:unnamed protein product [Phytophthora fragariaefolia]